MDTDIELYDEAWAPGTRTKTQLGALSCEIFVDDREPARITAWIRAQLKLLEVLRAEARAVCGSFTPSLSERAEAARDNWEAWNPGPAPA